MKKMITFASLLIILVSVPTALFSEGAVETLPQTELVDSEDVSIVLPQGLSLEEYNGLLLMREEEKLARDVYLELGDIWGIKVFTNIARSEQTHMNAVLTILETYGISDPIVDDTRGIFTNPELSALYSDLIEQGSQSITEAFTVGAIIEDLDIKDLRILLSETENEDIIRVYKNLEKGSENHMRAFIRQLERDGSSYKAQFITDIELAEIVKR